MSSSEGLGNTLLDGLGGEPLRAVRQRLERTSLPLRQVLAEPGERVSFVYFPIYGVVSRLGTTLDGRSIELACTGREGAVGTLNALADAPIAYRLVAQIPGEAWRLPVTDLRRLATSHPPLLHLLNCYASVVLVQLAQAAVCARFHTARQRLARWLLTAADRAGVANLPWSHEWVAEMVGGPRSAVSSAAAALRAESIIAYRRGGISIDDHARLEAAACECVHVVRDAVERFNRRCVD